MKLAATATSSSAIPAIQLGHQVPRYHAGEVDAQQVQEGRIPGVPAPAMHVAHELAHRHLIPERGHRLVGAAGRRLVGEEQQDTRRRSRTATRLMPPRPKVCVNRSARSGTKRGWRCRTSVARPWRGRLGSGAASREVLRCPSAHASRRGRDYFTTAASFSPLPTARVASSDQQDLAGHLHNLRHRRDVGVLSDLHRRQRLSAHRRQARLAAAAASGPEPAGAALERREFLSSASIT